MKKRYRTYQESLYAGLQDPQEAIAYLNAALVDEDQRVFLLALKDVLSAQNVDISVFAQESHLTRQSIYRMLSSSGNPRWDNLWSLINAMGLQVQLTSKNRK